MAQNSIDIHLALAEASEAKGRNGYFRARSADVCVVDGQIWLDVWSKNRSGDAAPCRLMLVPGDAVSIAEALLSLAADDADVKLKVGDRVRMRRPVSDRRYRGGEGRVTEVDAGGREGVVEIELDDSGAFRILEHADQLKVVEEVG